MMDMNGYTFSLYNMFLGEHFVPIFLFEIFLRTFIMYSYTLVNIRLLRTRSVAQLTSFELIIVIALGSAVGDPMFYPEIPLINCMVAITTIVALTKGISIITQMNDPLEKLIVGDPIMILKNGELLPKKLRKANLSIEELNARLRNKGIKNTGQVEYAFIETSGQLSVIEAAEPREGTSTLNHFDI